MDRESKSLRKQQRLAPRGGAKTSIGRLIRSLWPGLASALRADRWDGARARRSAAEGDVFCAAAAACIKTTRSSAFHCHYEY